MYQLIVIEIKQGWAQANLTDPHRKASEASIKFGELWGISFDYLESSLFKKRNSLLRWALHKQFFVGKYHYIDSFRLWDFEKDESKMF